MIDAVGPGGHFLGQAHTRRHMKETVERSIGQEIGPDGAHLRDPLEVARERGLDILENYVPEPLDEDEGGGAGAHLRGGRRRAARLSGWRTGGEPARRRPPRASVGVASPPDSTYPSTSRPPQLERRLDVEAGVGLHLQRDAVGDRHREQRQRLDLRRRLPVAGVLSAQASSLRYHSKSSRRCGCSSSSRRMCGTIS